MIAKFLPVTYGHMILTSIWRPPGSFSCSSVQISWHLTIVMTSRCDEHSNATAAVKLASSRSFCVLAIGEPHRLLICNACHAMANRSLNGTTRIQPCARLPKVFAGFLNNELPRLTLPLVSLRLIDRAACASASAYERFGSRGCWSNPCIKLFESSLDCRSNPML